MSRTLTKFQITKESTGEVVESDTIQYLNWDGLRFTAQVQEDNVTFAVQEILNKEESIQEWVMCRGWDNAFYYLSLHKVGKFLIMTNDMVSPNVTDTVKIKDLHDEKITVKRVLFDVPIRKEISKGSYDNCYIHPFPSDYYMDWDGNEKIFYVQPIYTGNYFEIVTPGSPPSSVFSDILEYVHAINYDFHYCKILTLPFSSKRAFLDYKAGGSSPSVRAYLHFANYQLENICATIDGTSHDCSYH